VTNLGEFRLLAPKAIWSGVMARIVQGERITMALNELDPETLVPEHRHDHEQLGFVVTGSITFTLDEETSTLGPGGTWRMLGGVPHSAQAGPEGAVVVDVFSPPRADWDELESERPRSPVWPPGAIETT
jgi:unsaturated pyranuronate lyase